MALTDKLTAIADAIRAKTGKSGALTLDAMPSEIASIQGGGSTDVPFEFGGMNAELVSEYSEDFTLADTSFVKGTAYPSNSTSIKATVSNRYTNTTGSPTYAYGDKDIVVVQTIDVDVEHEEGATNVARFIKGSYVMVTWISKRKTTDTSGKISRQVMTSATGYMGMKYYNSSGVLSRVVGTPYGFYGTPQAPSISSVSSASAYVRVSSPALACRTSTIYESQENISLVKDVIWHWNVKVYAVDPFSTFANAIFDVHDAFLTDATPAMASFMSLDDEEV